MVVDARRELCLHGHASESDRGRALRMMREPNRNHPKCFRQAHVIDPSVGVGEFKRPVALSVSILRVVFWTVSAHFFSTWTKSSYGIVAIHHSGNIGLLTTVKKMRFDSEAESHASRVDNLQPATGRHGEQAQCRWYHAF